jgi:hypothetical protein
MGDNNTPEIGKRIRYKAHNFGADFFDQEGVIYGDKSTLHCVWRDFAVRFETGKVKGRELAVYAKDIEVID